MCKINTNVRIKQMIKLSYLSISRTKIYDKKFNNRRYNNILNNSTKSLN
jgi:hypothetical protein